MSARTDAAALPRPTLLERLRSNGSAPVLVVLAVLVAVMLGLNPGFFEPPSLMAFLRNAAPLVVLAIGQYFVIVSGEFDLFTRLEHVSGDLLTDRVLAGVGGAHLDVVAARGEVVLTQVIAERLVHLARVDVAVAELNRGVPIGLRGTDASHDSWAGLQHRHRHNFAGLVEDLGHAELFAQDSLDLLGRHVFSVL